MADPRDERIAFLKKQASPFYEWKERNKVEGPETWDEAFKRNPSTRDVFQARQFAEELETLLSQTSSNNLSNEPTESSRSSHGASPLGILAMPAALFVKDRPELMENQGKYGKIKQELLKQKEKEWKKLNPKKHFWSRRNYHTSKEYIDYYYGSLDTPDAPTIDTEAEKLFREKHPKIAKDYDESGVKRDKKGNAKQYKKASDDPAYISLHGKMEAYLQSRLSLLGKNATQEEKEALEKQIRTHEYDKWVAKHPERAAKYAELQKTYKQEDKDIHLDEALAKYQKQKDIESTKTQLEEYAKREGGKDIKLVEDKVHRATPTVSQDQAAQRLEAAQKRFTDTQKPADQNTLVSPSGRVLSTPIQPPASPSGLVSATGRPISSTPRTTPAIGHSPVATARRNRMQPMTSMFNTLRSLQIPRGAGYEESRGQASSDLSNTVDNAEGAFKAGRTALRIGQWAIRAFGGGGTAAGGTAAAGAVGGAAGGAAAAGGTAAGGAAVAAGAPVGLIVGTIILVALLVIVLFVVIFGCVLGWFQGCGTFNVEDNAGIKGLNIEKTGPSQVENPGGKSEMSYNISVVYEGNEDVLITDPIPSNTRLVIATGNGCPLYKQPTTEVVWRLKDCPRPQETGQQIYNFIVKLEPLKPDIIVKNTVIASVIGGSTGEPPTEGSSGNACTEPHEGKGYCSVENLKKYFDGNGSKALVASMICKIESNSNPNSENKKCPDYSIGLYQINLLAHCPAARPNARACTFADISERDKCEVQYKDPENNVQKMVSLSQNGTNWNPWSAYTDPNIGVRKKLTACGIN